MSTSKDVEALQQTAGLIYVYPRSVVADAGTLYCLGRNQAREKVLCVAGDIEGFDGVVKDGVRICPLWARNARELRSRLPWLNPVPLGLDSSAGCGDRLGLATPGHVRAMRKVGKLAPIFAQQSMRENARTGRSPQEVMDDAMWGVFQEGWRQPWGADADHLKVTDNVTACVQAGYTFFTFDPGAYVDNEAHTAGLATLQRKFDALPWDRLHDHPDAMRARYVGRIQQIEAWTFRFDEQALLRAACKYGAALAHVAQLYCTLANEKGNAGFEVEISVDETETPTSPLEHIFIASELRRLGVTWISLAPRYVGRFEKGVDYIGDLAEFEEEFSQHAAIARVLGPYKLSIHSGSDKFSIYGIMARHTGGLIHLKTAGTSYLEALRTVAQVDPDLFRDILRLARAQYQEERATYHVSANVCRVPAPDTVEDHALPTVLESFDGRQVLHVTFGSVLDAYGDRLYAVLDEHEELHYKMLEAHFVRHLAPFAEHACQKHAHEK